MLTVYTGLVTLLKDAAEAGHAGLRVVVESGAKAVFAAGQTLGELKLDANASAEMAAGASKTMLLHGIAMHETARFDLRNSAVIVRGGGAIGTYAGGTYDGLTGLIARGYNFSQWNGNGIRTSMADAAAGLTTIGISSANDIGMPGFAWRGVTLQSGDVLLMYTYAGDPTVDGRIDAGDYGIIDNFVQVAGASGYGNGDFNYDGFIDAGDYGIIDNNIQAQGTPL